MDEAESQIVEPHLLAETQSEISKVSRAPADQSYGQHNESKGQIEMLKWKMEETEKASIAARSALEEAKKIIGNQKDILKKQESLFKFKEQEMQDKQREREMAVRREVEVQVKAKLDGQITAKARELDDRLKETEDQYRSEISKI